MSVEAIARQERNLLNLQLDLPKDRIVSWPLPVYFRGFIIGMATKIEDEKVTLTYTSSENAAVHGVISRMRPKPVVAQLYENCTMKFQDGRIASNQDLIVIEDAMATA